jgi:acetaldehyde dehydrogenase/alcohol dehydrogenase
MKPVVPAMNTFITPREVIWGRGSVQYLAKVKGSKSLIVTDKILVKLGAVEKLEHYLKKAGVICQIFDEVEPEFVTTTIVKMVEKHKSFNPDIVIGLGGGSVLDASKAFRIFYEYPDLTFADILPIAGPPRKVIPPFNKTISITIPTTSGTGSEVTPVFIVTNPENNDKDAVFSFHLVADVAILDPDFTDSMPKTLQIDTGLDALSHAIPSYISNFSNDLSKACAMQAVRLIMKYLEVASQGDREAKAHLHYAACLAGKAFANSGIGLEHYFGHFFGSKFHISHGRACAIALPHVIKFNAAAAPESIMELAQAIGYIGNDNNAAASYLVRRVSDLKKRLGVAANLREHGILESAYTAELPHLIKDFNRAPMTPPILSNPQKCTEENMKALYNEMCFDTGIL